MTNPVAKLRYPLRRARPCVACEDRPLEEREPATHAETLRGVLLHLCATHWEAWYRLFVRGRSRVAKRLKGRATIH